MILGPNLGHPLNRNRLTWHLALPGRDAGSRSVDLMGRVNGTLVGFDSTTGWQGAQRPGSFARAIKIKDANSYLDLGSLSAQLTGLANASMAWWINHVGVVTTSIGQGTANTRFMMEWKNDTNIYCEAENGSNQSFPFYTYTESGWTRLLMTFDGSAGASAVKLYVNGLPRTLSAGGGSSTTALVAPSTLNFRAGIGGTTTGTFDDVTVWTRTLTPADAWMDYSLSRAGYPGVLLRSSAARYAAGSAVSGGGGGATIVSRRRPGTMRVGSRGAGS